MNSVLRKLPWTDSDSYVVPLFKKEEARVSFYTDRVEVWFRYGGYVLMGARKQSGIEAENMVDMCLKKQGDWVDYEQYRKEQKNAKKA